MGMSAFANCDGLKTITLPSTLSGMDSYVFSGCDGLSEITTLAVMPPTITSSTFSGIPNAVPIHVPCGARELYSTEKYWQDLTTLSDAPTAVVTLQANEARMGEAVMTTSNTCDNDEAVITAFPHQGCRFVKWNDEITDNPRKIFVVGDITYTAIFEAMTTYQLSADFDGTMGYVTGTGTYIEGETATLTATPLSGYRFEKWSDGMTDNPRTITMTGNLTLSAVFIRGEYCGKEILWTLEDNTLALNGTGAMYNQPSFGWYAEADDITAITLSEGITTIGTNAFLDLMFVPSVSIPASVTTIHKRAFENCRSMATVTFADGSKLKEVGNWAFFQCMSLKDINLPEGVTTIGNGAFYGCAYLENLTLPSSMETIADNGFALCSKLKSMTVNAPEPPAVESKTFENVDRSIPVYVPVGSAPKYKAAAVWKEFNIQGDGEPTSVETPADCDQPSVWKIVRDGQVYILRGDKMYTVTGIEVK